MRSQTASYSSATEGPVQSAGFRGTIPGVVYRGGGVIHGVPLGGLGTGYIELDGAGRFGQTTIFNNFPPAYTEAQPHSIMRPFLAVAVNGATRVLALSESESEPGAQDIAYFGHFPIADLEYSVDLPLAVSMRAWTPFIPGRARDSNIPAAIFEVRVRSRMVEAADVRVGFSFTSAEWGQGTYRRDVLAGPTRGVKVTSELYGADAGYAIAVDGADGFDVGSLLGTESTPWSSLVNGLTQASEDEPGTAVAATVRLLPDAERTIRFVLAWYYPAYRVQASPYHHMYGHRFSGLDDVLSQVGRRRGELLARVIEWQQAIYDSDLTGWLQDALINSLYCLAKNSWWTYSDAADDWWGPDGLLTINETFRDCPVTETLPCRFFGHFPILFFFPELERGTLREFARYQLRNGQVPFAFAYGSGLNDPRYQCVHPQVSGMFVQLLLRYYLRTGDKEFLAEMAEGVRDGISYLKSLDTDSDGLVDDHPHNLPGTLWPANNYYDAFPFHGASVYTAGTWLATLRAAAAIGDIIGDHQLQSDALVAFERGAETFDRKLWNGNFYRLYSDTASGEAMEVSLANQLMVEWCTRVVGLGRSLPENRIRPALDSVERLNIAASHVGAVSAVTLDGAPLHLMGDSMDQSGSCMVSEATILGMTMMYEGRQQKGEEIVRNMYHAHAVRHQTPWDQYYLISPDDGSPVWGGDYYSNLIVWAVPMALAGQDLTEFSHGPFIRSVLAD